MKGITLDNQSVQNVLKRLPNLANPAAIMGLAFFFIIPSPLFSQNKTIDRANELYKYDRFAEAINLYEEALQEITSNNRGNRQTGSIKTKLAYCYRMTNKTDKAEVLYAEVVKDEKTKPETYLYYGEALMSNGKYEVAKKWFNDYLKLEPQDEQGRRLIEACNSIPFIQPYFSNIEIQEFSQNSLADDNGPIAWLNGIVFSSDRKQGLKLMKEKSGWTGRDYLELYYAERIANNSFAEPKKFSGKLSEVNKNIGNASFSSDGALIFFTRNDNELNKQKAYNLQLFCAESTGADRWKNVQKLPFCSPAYNFMHPAISPDGKWLFFASNKPGGEGGTDLWVSEKKGNDWGKPENLGPAINTSANEGFPFVDVDGKLFFCSKGHPGYGGFDIFFSEKNEMGRWKAPVNLGKPINSSLDDISIFIYPDGKSGMFTSSREGGDDDIYLFSIKSGVVTPLLAKEKIDFPIETIQKDWTKENNSDFPPINTTPPPIQPSIQNEEPESTERFINEPEISMEPREDNSLKASTENLPGAPVENPVEVKIINDELRANKDIQPSIKKIEPVLSDTIYISGLGMADGDQPLLIPSFIEFEKKLANGFVIEGERFRLPGATYDPNVWQLTPRITVTLDKIVKYMQENPSLEIEISAHTESLGSDEENLVLSRNRAEKAIEYIVWEGISRKRLTAKGYGETLLLNHCQNGVPCKMEEHLYNQRLEMKVIKR